MTGCVRHILRRERGTIWTVWINRYGSLVQATPEQSIRAFKLKENFEEELRVIKLKMGE